MTSQPNGVALHHYYNAASSPCFNFNLPAHSVYCTSGHNSIWQHYFLTSNNYPVCILIIKS